MATASGTNKKVFITLKSGRDGEVLEECDRDERPPEIKICEKNCGNFVQYNYRQENRHVRIRLQKGQKTSFSRFIQAP